jgi:hypothetical protein
MLTIVTFRRRWHTALSALTDRAYDEETIIDELIKKLPNWVRPYLGDRQFKEFKEFKDRLVSALDRAGVKNEQQNDGNKGRAKGGGISKEFGEPRSKKKYNAGGPPNPSSDGQWHPTTQRERTEENQGPTFNTSDRNNTAFNRNPPRGVNTRETFPQRFENRQETRNYQFNRYQGNAVRDEGRNHNPNASDRRANRGEADNGERNQANEHERGMRSLQSSARREGRTNEVRNEGRTLFDPSATNRQQNVNVSANVINSSEGSNASRRPEN